MYYEGYIAKKGKTGTEIFLREDVMIIKVGSK